MFAMAIDILHWIAGAVLALVGISYDRVEECAPVVRQQAVIEATLTHSGAAVHFLAEEVNIEERIGLDGSKMVVVHASGTREVSGCATLPVRLPSPPAAPVLRL